MKTGVNISYALIDVTAEKDATLSTENIRKDAILSDLHRGEGEIPKVMALEGGGIPLDGSYDFFPEDTREDFFGVWSENLSDENGMFEKIPAIFISFSVPHTSAGLTLHFAEGLNEFATDCTVIWFDENKDILENGNFEIKGTSTFLEKQVEDYYGIAIGFLGTNKPQHYVKLSRIIYGVHKNFGEKNGDALISAQTTEQIDFTASAAPISTLTFSFHSMDGEFDLLNLAGAYRLFQQKQRVLVEKTIDGISEPMGTYYLETSEFSDGITELYCTDLLGVIDKTNYRGGFWPNGILAGELANEIMESAGELEQITIDEALAEMTVYGYLPPCSHREALKKLAFALMAVLQVKRDGKIYITPLSFEPKTEITSFDKVASHSIRQADLVTGVQVYLEKYVSNGDEASEIFSETLTAGQHTVFFENPAIVSKVSGALLVRSGATYATIQVESDRIVTIYGTEYHAIKTLAGTKYASALSAAGKENVQSVSVSLYSDAGQMAEHLYGLLQLRLSDNGRIFEIGAAPADAVLIAHGENSALLGIITELTTNLSDGLIAKMEAVGNAKTK